LNGLWSVAAITEGAIGPGRITASHRQALTHHVP
jgi:hypothetical protein